LEAVLEFAGMQDQQGKNDFEKTEISFNDVLGY